MKALSTGLYCTLIFLICSSADSSSLASAEFESILRATDCIKVANEKAFELRVLGRSFPAPQGYNFEGLFRGEAVFSADPDLDLLENVNIYSDRAAMDSALEQWDASSGSFQYYEMQPDDRNIEQRLKEFDALQWSGLTVYFSASAGEGWGKNSTTYQVIVHAEGHDGEIRITTSSPQRIADIIACAEDSAENGDFSQWKYRASDESVEKAQRFAFEAMGSNCSRSFSPADVAEFIQGTPDSDVVLTARRKDDEIIGYGIYHVQNVKHLLDAGLRNGDVLVSVCGIPVTDVFGGDGESFREPSFCCKSELENPSLLFERGSEGKIIRLPFP